MHWMRLLILLALAEIQTGASANAEQFGPCYGKLAPVLTRGHFTGEPDCGKVAIDLKKVGNIRSKDGVISIYNLIYKTLGSEVSHGGQRLLLIKDNRKYIGGYHLTTPPFKSISIIGDSIYLDKSTYHEGKITFASGKPPSTVNIDGDISAFGK